MVSLRRRHRATLEAIFRRPTSGTIRWDDIESLLLACGARIAERAGSRVVVDLHGYAKVFHRPHPSSETDKKTVESMRNFLAEAGIFSDDQ